MSYANIKKETFQAEGNSSWDDLETQAPLQYLKTNKHNKYVEGSGAGADEDGERRRR